jgi:hypothetical protein
MQKLVRMISSKIQAEIERQQGRITVIPSVISQSSSIARIIAQR